MENMQIQNCIHLNHVMFSVFFSIMIYFPLQRQCYYSHLYCKYLYIQASSIRILIFIKGVYPRIRKVNTQINVIIYICCCYCCCFVCSNSETELKKKHSFIQSACMITLQYHVPYLYFTAIPGRPRITPRRKTECC